MKYSRELFRIAVVTGLLWSFWSMEAHGQNNESDQNDNKGITMESLVAKAGYTTHKITRKDIQRLSGFTVAELLNTLPGVHIGGAVGTPGSALTYNFRGGKNRQTLILLDGVLLNDPSSLANDYDLRLPDVSMIEQIEVLKGGALALYGSGAVAAVINIQLKESQVGKPEYTVSQSLGSFLSSNTMARVEGRSFRFGYVASTSLGISRGFSAADEGDLGAGFGNDGFLKFSTRAKMTFDKSQEAKHQYNFSFDYLKSGYDDGAFMDADNQFSLTQFNLSRVKTGRVGKLKGGAGAGGMLLMSSPSPTLLGNSLLSALGMSLGTGHYRSKLSLNLVNRKFDSSFPSNVNGFSVNYNNEMNRKISRWLSWIIGFQSQWNFMKNPNKNISWSIFFSNYQQLAFQISPEFSITTGGRMTFYKTLRDINFVYNINPTYTLRLGSDNFLKLFGSYATAFVAPTLAQIATPRFGNGSLDVEESTSWEIGSSLYLGKSFTINLEYFNRTEENAIDLVTLYDEFGNRIGAIYSNIDGQRELSGVEADFRYEVNSSFQLSAHFAKYRFENPSMFYQIPDLKYGLRATYNLSRKTNFGLNYSHFGEREELTPDETSTISLRGFNVVDISFAHELKGRDLVINGAVRNLLNEGFVDLYGFKRRPISFNIGIAAKL